MNDNRNNQEQIEDVTQNDLQNQIEAEAIDPIEPETVDPIEEEALAVLPKGNKQIVKFANDASNLTELFEFAEALKASNLVNSSPADTVAKIILGREAGLGPATSLFKIMVIDGKPSLPTAIQSQLLTEAGIQIDVLKDYKHIRVVTYESKLKELFDVKDIKADRKKFFIVGLDNKNDAKPQDGQDIVRPFVREDYVTEIQFTLPNGRVITENYYFSEAVTAGLAKKDNWKKNPRDMMYARVISRAMRRHFGHLQKAASYTPEELNPDLRVDEAGEPIIEEVD